MIRGWWMVDGGWTSLEDQAACVSEKYGLRLIYKYILDGYKLL
jgi:hypothetical protein